MSSLASHYDFTRVPAKVLNATTQMMVYLSDPPPSSWVVRVAATFRILALLLVVPCVFLTLLVRLYNHRPQISQRVFFQDVASYLIVRTLGADTAHRVSLTATYGTPDTQINTSFDNESNRPPKAPELYPHILVTDTSAETKSDPSPSSSSDSEHVPELSGEGIFSPPISRAGSPPILRHKRSMLENDDHSNILRRRA